MRILAGLVGLFLFLATNSFGQRGELNLAKGVVKLSKLDIRSIERKKSRSDFGKSSFIFQFKNLPSTADKRAWEKEGLELIKYVPPNAYVALVDQSFDVPQFFSNRNDVWVAPIPAQLKMPKDLVSGESYRLKVYDQFEFNQAIDNLRSVNGVSIDEINIEERIVQIKFSGRKYSSLTELSFVEYIEVKLPEPILEKPYRNTVGKANFLSSGYGGINYNGTGSSLSISEGGNIDPVDFKGRHTPPGNDISGHKTGSAQNAGGAGNLNPNYRSNAWGAEIVEGSTNYYDMINTHGVPYTNHSYGYGLGGGYGGGSSYRDKFVREHPTGIVSYSSGNIGGSVGAGVYSDVVGYSNLTGSVKHAKNILAINNLSPSDEVSFGSKGPAFDGRVKPEMAIEGWEGTSFASPKVIGYFAILNEIYRDNYSGVIPASTLLKGILMNSADDVGRKGVDFETGYGRPNLRRAHDLIIANQFDSNSIESGQEQSIDIVVPANAKQLRVMLVWADYEAVSGVATALVNNLDLNIATPTNDTILPWVLNHYPHIDSLEQLPMRKVDVLNNTEQVTIDNPSAGTYTVNIEGTSVPMGPQSYHIVYEILYEDLQLTYPIKDEQWLPGTEQYIKWDSYGDSLVFDLEYQLNGGAWQTIASNIDADLRNYLWDIPEDLQGSLKMRVKKGGATSVSDSFSIFPQPDFLEVQFVCGDEARLVWGEVPGAAYYEVFNLGEKYMEIIDSSAATSKLITGLALDGTHYFSVQAVGPNGERGQRLNAVEANAGDDNCFYCKTGLGNDVRSETTILTGFVNPHNQTLTNVYFEYGQTDTYGQNTDPITFSATGHESEKVTATINFDLDYTNEIHFRLRGTINGTDQAIGENRIVRFAPGGVAEFKPGEYINMGNPKEQHISKDQTISFWIKPAVNPSGRYNIIEGGYGGEMNVVVDVDGSLLYYYGPNGGNSSPDQKVGSIRKLVFGEWNHVAIVRNLLATNRTIEMYINGRKDVSTAANFAEAGRGSDNIYLGKKRSYTVNFDGELDEIRIWNTVRTEEQLRDHAHIPLTGDESGLVYYLNFDQGPTSRPTNVVDAAEYKRHFVNVVEGSHPIGTGVVDGGNQTDAIELINSAISVDYIENDGVYIHSTKLDELPKNMEGIVSEAEVLDSSYWIVQLHDDVAKQVNLTFDLDFDIPEAEASTPQIFHLVARAANEDGNWNFLKIATTVDAITDKITFNDISLTDMQFAVLRNAAPGVYLSETEPIKFINIKKDQPAEVFASEVIGVGISENVTIETTSPFEISFQETTGFANTLILFTNVNQCRRCN